MKYLDADAVSRCVCGGVLSGAACAIMEEEEGE